MKRLLGRVGIRPPAPTPEPIQEARETGPVRPYRITEVVDHYGRDARTDVWLYGVWGYWQPDQRNVAANNFFGLYTHDGDLVNTDLEGHGEAPARMHDGWRTMPAPYTWPLSASPGRTSFASMEAGRPLLMGRAEELPAPDPRQLESNYTVERVRVSTRNSDEYRVRMTYDLDPEPRESILAFYDRYDGLRSERSGRGPISIDLDTLRAVEVDCDPDTPRLRMLPMPEVLVSYTDARRISSHSDITNDNRYRYRVWGYYGSDAGFGGDVRTWEGVYTDEGMLCYSGSGMADAPPLVRIEQIIARFMRHN